MRRTTFHLISEDTFVSLSGFTTTEFNVATKQITSRSLDCLLLSLLSSSFRYYIYIPLVSGNIASFKLANSPNGQATEYLSKEK
jgi:hypothetical protein